MMKTEGANGMRILRGASLLLVATAFVAGCSDQKPQPKEENRIDITEPAPPIETPPEPVRPEPKPPEPVVNTVAAAEPEEVITPDEQMLEDADASGMTARTAPSDVVADAPADPLGAPVIESGGRGSN
jgi:outer membrane biosynthesis protein TonB